jgi:hypothetical protein
VPGDDRAKFDKLGGAVKQQLSGVKVYKVGDELEKAVYVVGKTVDGKGPGLMTSVVETEVDPIVRGRCDRRAQRSEN